MIISRISLSHDVLFEVYTDLLLTAFSVERQVEVYLPVHYGSQKKSEEANLNLNLKEYYFDEKIPSLFTCLFNKNPTDFDSSLIEEDLLIRLNNRLDACPTLLIPVAIERLVLLDKYYKAREMKTIEEECKSVALSLCERVFNHDLVHSNEVIVYD